MRTTLYTMCNDLILFMIPSLNKSLPSHKNQQSNNTLPINRIATPSHYIDINISKKDLTETGLFFYRYKCIE